MFKKLRNNLLLINMIIISALVVGCLSAIYITTYSFVKQNVDERLDGAVRMSMSFIAKEQSEAFLERKPPKKAENNKVRHEQPVTKEREDMFYADISVYCDREGNVISTHAAFTPEGFDFSDKVKEIIASNKAEGSNRLDVDSWAYKRVEWGDGYIVAFTKNEAERNMLFTLAVILVVVGIAAILVSFAVSRFSANRSILPIEDAYNKQKQFVADASHELRTPLASISANTDVLLSKSDSVIPSERKWLEYIKEETERMTALTNDLLLLAKTDSSENKTVLSSVDFSNVAEDAILELEASAFENGISIESDIQENVKAEATRSGLKQIVIILLDNAIKYTSGGNEINVSLKTDGGKAVFKVENPGMIAKADLPHVFERFFRADKSRASDGYGLGLPIAKSLCKGFGGDIDVKSENGVTAFNVSLNKI